MDSYRYGLLLIWIPANIDSYCYGLLLWLLPYALLPVQIPTAINFNQTSLLNFGLTVCQNGLKTIRTPNNVDSYWCGVLQLHLPIMETYHYVLLLLWTPASKHCQISYPLAITSLSPLEWNCSCSLCTVHTVYLLYKPEISISCRHHI
jgi:hypothetical protein